MALTSIGGSGLDIKAIVSALVTADITPSKNRLDRQESDYSTQISALGLIKSSLSKLQTALSKLSDLSQINKLKSTISDESYFSASLSGNVEAGNYQIEVQQLASQQSLATAVFTSPTSTVGSGTISIEFGTYSPDNSSFTANPAKNSVNINIPAGTDSLTAIRDAINNSGSGVQASIVQDGQGARLTLLSPETGKASAMRITVTDADGNNSDGNGLSALTYDPTAAIQSMTQTIAAADSLVKINGLLLTQSSNELKDAISGVTLNLKKAQTGVQVNFKIDQDKSSLTNAINDFIKQYNDSMTTLNSLTNYNATSKTGGPMQSDSDIRALKFNLTNMATQALTNANTSIRSLGDIGIKTDEKGLLVMDQTKFNKAVSDHYDEIASLFAKTAVATDSNVLVKSVGAAVKAGQYDLALTAFTPGSILSGTIGGINANSNDGYTLSGTGNLTGLSLEIIGGSIGSRGQIQVRDGLAVKLNDLLDSYLDEKTGDLKQRTDQLNKRLKELDDKRQQLEYHTDQLTQRYTKQFTALDALLVKMQGTSDFLNQQLASISNISQFNRK
nr:flagellar filament capping protein FliD [Legionella jordanis]